MAEQNEKKNKRIGMAVTLGLHAILIILFFFIMAWREPNPPLEEYGIELNFGLDQAGSGETQRTVAANQVRAQDQPAAKEEITKPAPEEEVKPQEPAPPAPKAEEAVATQPEESPDVRPEKVVKTEKKVEKPVEKPADKPVQKPITKTTQPAPKETAVADANKKGENKPASGSNQGDDVARAGDKGNPQGTIDSRNLYGTPGGGGGGASLNMAGWMWDDEPKPRDNSQETGRLVFKVMIDDEGSVLQITSLENTVSPAIAKIYEEAVRRTTFSKTHNGVTPPTSTGTITFIIKSR